MNFIENSSVHTYGEIKIKIVNNKFFILKAPGKNLLQFKFWIPKFRFSYLELHLANLYVKSFMKFSNCISDFTDIVN